MMSFGCLLLFKRQRRRIAFIDAHVGGCLAYSASFEVQLNKDIIIT